MYRLYRRLSIYAPSRRKCPLRYNRPLTIVCFHKRSPWIYGPERIPNLRSVFIAYQRFLQYGNNEMPSETTKTNFCFEFLENTMELMSSFWQFSLEISKNFAASEISCLSNLDAPSPVTTAPLSAIRAPPEGPLTTAPPSAIRAPPKGRLK